MDSLISLTEKAHQQIKLSLKSREKTLGLRLGVKTSGCSGLAYVLEYADQIQTHDRTIDCDDFLILIDEKNLPYLKGMRLDYVQEGLNEGFKFENPNVQATCGCGESFTVDASKAIEHDLM